MVSPIIRRTGEEEGRWKEEEGRWKEEEGRTSGVDM
jgi:hypothetical protein